MSGIVVTHPVHGDPNEEMRYDSILAALREERISAIVLEPDGHFEVMEMCDVYFRLNLTRAQLRELGQEILALADSV